MSKTAVRNQLHVVLRGNLSANGVELARGEVVDTGDWRNVQPLINVRQLAPLERDVRPVGCPCGRRWINQSAADNHHCEEKN